ncbi:hypothetical protein [Mycoplasma sp. OR1901]|uniref:hypothetical protein n=1 Tax=Mycoplasma sp. OR1901 TaxID=2742195 RepID=UPI001582BC69|nr:hypothetical protein [Mycoplasma sp. OR1901]QKT05226.1 hypothetical protein HTZ87_00695 [Mycoplasma sp. OR1901]
MSKKFSNKLSSLHKSQYSYIALWVLFAILLVAVVLISTLYVKPSDAEAIAARANTIAAVALLFVIVFLGAIVATVYVHGFVLKKAQKNSISKSGGKK